MIVKCPSCEARFRIPEAKIKPTGTKVRCGKCRTMFRVALASGPSDTPQSLESPAVGEPRSSELRGSSAGSGRSPEPALGLPGFLGEGTLEVPALDISDLEALDQQSERVRVEAIAAGAATGAGMPVSAPRVPVPPPAAPAAAPSKRLGKLKTKTKAKAQPAAGVLRSAAAATTRPATTTVAANLSKPTPRRDEAPPERHHTPNEAIPAVVARSTGSTLPPESPSPPAEESWSAEFAAEQLAERPVPASPLQPPAPEPRRAVEPREHRSPSASLDASTPTSGAHRAARWMAVALAVVLTLVAFLGFVALRNGGAIDFSDMGRMFGVAFGGESYPERSLRVLRVYEVEGQVVEEPVVELHVPLRIDDVEQTIYMTQNRVPLVLVQGSLRNDGADPHRRIVVGGRVYQGAELVATAHAPVGATATPEDLEALVAPEDVEALYRTLEQNASDFVINGNEGSLFTLVFPASEALTEAPEQMSYEVELVSAEWLDAADGWQRLEYDLEEPGDAIDP